MPSGSAVITVQDGDNAIIYIPGANNALTPKRMDQRGETENSEPGRHKNEVPVEAIEEASRPCSEIDVPSYIIPHLHQR
ncbi:MAG: hypothetical protein U5K84_04120 [Alkalibacterium sp.]|nr:hypothetical protein [Alkalibacterium sp.]